MYIDDIAQIYEGENLKFILEEDRQRIWFRAATKNMAELVVLGRIVDPNTVMFTTAMPVNIPADKRDVMTVYLNRVNWGTILGNFEMDPSDGRVSYRVTGCYDETDEVNEDVIIRMTYIGLNMFEKYAPGMFAIVYGNKSPEEAFREAEQNYRAGQTE